MKMDLLLFDFFFYAVGTIIGSITVNLSSGLIISLIIGLIAGLGGAITTWLTTNIRHPKLRAGLGGLIFWLFLELTMGLNIGRALVQNNFLFGLEQTEALLFSLFIGIYIYSFSG